MQARPDGDEIQDGSRAGHRGQGLVGQRDRFVPAARAEQGVDADGHEIRRVPPLETQPLREVAAGEGFDDRLVALIGEQEIQGQVVVGHDEQVEGARQPREAPRLAELREPRVGVTERDQVRPQDVACPALRDGGVGRLRDAHRLEGDVAGLGIPAHPHQRPGERGQHLCTLRRRGLVRNQLDRGPVLGEGLLARALDPAQVPEPSVNEPGRRRIRDRVDGLERLRGRPQRGRLVTGGVERVRGSHEQGDAVRSNQGLRTPPVDIEGVEQVARGRRMGVHGGGRLRRVEARGEGLLGPVRRQPMPGTRRGHRCARFSPRQPGTPRTRARGPRGARVARRRAAPSRSPR